MPGDEFRDESLQSSFEVGGGTAIQKPAGIGRLSGVAHLGIQIGVVNRHGRLAGRR